MRQGGDAETFTTCEVLKKISANSDIVYMQTKDIWLGPVQTGPRDLVLLRYWRTEEQDGDFVITWQSIEDASLNVSKADGFVRGRIFTMSVHVTAAPGTGG
ncbi:hypothetical protein BASA81_012585 [Batrachochytrium salamandrivorans]|nr:hypothetical protein BASA81_012585 [Batrachochytrium salamandrivorans]